MIDSSSHNAAMHVPEKRVEWPAGVFGQTLLSVSIAGWVLFALEQIEKWEVLAELNRHLSFLRTSLWFLPVVTCAFLAILLAQELRFKKRSSTERSGTIIYDSNDRPARSDWMWVKITTLVICGTVALTLGGAVVGFSLYDPKLPPVRHFIRVPPICKTADCWPVHAQRELPQAISIGSLSQTGKNNIAQIGGRNNRAIINPATIQSIVLEARSVCDVKQGAQSPAEWPTPEMAFWLTGVPDASLRGSDRQIILKAVSPILYSRQSSPRTVVIERFVLPQDSAQIGQPIESVSFVDTVSVQMLGLAFKGWCSAVHGIDVSVAINGRTVWSASGFLEAELPDGAAPVWNTPVKGWVDKIKSVTD
jgi:hypothetical protein